ncbi:TetR family transcriptional regulator [Acinetobacter ursingii]|uniref:TetR family transcriptional regulator n=1 Tax=Acinetobacter ursingii TaxID=108980 RepID=UPI00124CA290|nr:TetR family transcriptional regulator [Acinetobacter ursingii]MCU4304737.1 TetR family transcriptional regulator [Acinetobacter ursingii]MCU4370742.1 TetR family transcriptional regulator [Acinetobacter ursingii]MDG9991806.1 TetR family transcriptional regulator [Acinetobacter ursingii]MDH0205301.1 TetR family transcriptional regulator [Acinetobacter ursingii]
MNYLNREQRRDMILAAAKTLALKEGLNALTVRAIATQAQVSTGQVHHHFESASHLKAQVFIELMDQLNELEAQVLTDSWLQRISLLLGCENIEQTQPYLRLWNEAEILIEQDIEIKKAYNLTMQRWHNVLVQLIQDGIQQKQFKMLATTTAQDVAWRLIAFVCGLEGIYQLGLQGLDQPSFQCHVEIMIKMELMNSI